MGIQINGQTDTVTATDGSINVGGDVTIPGVLTYEDVTNVDSVGIVTAQSGIHVTGGNVAVGHNNPSVNLHVKGSASNGQIYLGGTGAHSQIYADNDGVLILNADQGNSAANSYLGFNVDNSERLRIDSSGRVLIDDAATAGPMETFGSAVLQAATPAGGTLVLGRNDSSVSTDNGIGSIYFDVNDSSGNAWNETARITVNADGDHANNDYPSRMEFYTTGDGEATPTERLRIFNDGSVRIGDSSIAVAAVGSGPTLAINGSAPEITLRDSASGNPYAVMRTNDYGSLTLEADQGNNAANSTIHFRVDNAERMRINSSYLLHGDTTSDLSGTHATMFVGSNHAFQHDGNAGTYLTIAVGAANGTVDLEADARSGGYPDMRFITTNTERLRITADGKIGIGYNNPATKLVVASSDSTAADMRFQNQTTGYATNNGFWVGINNNENALIYNYHNSDLLFATNDTVRLTVSDDGHLCLGSNTNPAAGSTGGYDRVFNIQAGSSGALSSISFGDSNAIGRIESVNGNNGKIIINGSEYITFGTGGTPAERLRITSGGELLIGETSSGGTCKLGMSFGNATGNYIEMGGTSRTANGLSKLAVMRHGYWGGAREVGSIGFLTSSSSGGAGRGTANFVVHTGSSGNGDGGNSGDNLSIERLRVGSSGIFYVNTTASNNWSQTNNGPNNDNANGSNPSGNMCFRTAEGALVLANDADSGYSAIYINKYEWNSGDDNRWINFYLNGSGKDSITWNGSNIVYGNNSDYRIKTNIRSYTGGIDLVKQIPVRQYDYIETERGTDHVGFIAHELQEVLPDAVSGEKDAMRIEEETGEEVMDIQNVDYGRVTPILTAALKEAIAKIETLEAKVAALEGS